LHRITVVNGYRILLVEDQAIIAMSQQLELENHGYSVITCSSGEKAVSLVQDGEPIDLVLMDIDLGSGMDGTEAAQRILAARDVPLIFLSSHTEPEIVRKTENITSYGYVVKNAGITVLDAAIRMAFRLFAALQETQRAQDDLQKSYEEQQVLSEELRSSLDDVLAREARVKETEAELAGWNRLLDYIISHDNSAIAVLDQNLVFLYVSDRFRSDYRLDPDVAVAGRHHYEVFPDIPEKWRTVHRRALAGEVLSSDFDVYPRDDGTTDYTRWEARPWYTRNNAIGGIILYTEVLTERVRESQAYRDAERRFQGLLRLHHALLQFNDGRSVSLDQYLETVVKNLIACVQNAERIDTRVECEPIRLGADVLAPIGIAVTELVTNAVKHGVADRERARLDVAARLHSGPEIEITVQDDGPGISADPPADPGSGLTLVRTLANQLDGRLLLESDGGLSASIVFPISDPDTL
jgi:two-component sensor histidine kinase/DNA-binding response OmpR family regulator